MRRKSHTCYSASCKSSWKGLIEIPQVVNFLVNVNLCCKEDASHFIHFGEHLSRFWLFLQAAGVCWDSENHCSFLGNELPFQRHREGWKNESYCNTQRGAGVAVRNEVKTSWVWKSQLVLKMCSLERPAGRSQVFWPVSVGTLLEIGSVTTGTSLWFQEDLEGSWGICHCSSRCWCPPAVPHCCWAGTGGCRVLLLCRGALALWCKLFLFCPYSHHHSQMILSPVKTVNLKASE